MSEGEGGGLRATLTSRLAATTLLAMLVGAVAGALAFWAFPDVGILFVLAALFAAVGLGAWLSSHEPHRPGSVAIMVLGALLGVFLLLLAQLLATAITNPPVDDRAGVVAAILGLGLACASSFGIAHRVSGRVSGGWLLGAVTWILIAGTLLLALFAAVVDPQ